MLGPFKLHFSTPDGKPQRRWGGLTETGVARTVHSLLDAGEDLLDLTIVNALTGEPLPRSEEIPFLALGSVTSAIDDVIKGRAEGQVLNVRTEVTRSFDKLMDAI